MRVAADLRAAAILRRIKQINAPIGVEVGVFRGDLSQRLLREHESLTLYMVDPWTTHENNEVYKNSGDFHATLPQEAQDFLYEETKRVVAPFLNRAIILREFSICAALKFEDNSIDFAFIDAQHTYEGVSEDVRIWKPKIKSGGWLCGHDFGRDKFPGVTKAVVEFADENNLKGELDQNYTWFIRMP